MTDYSNYKAEDFLQDESFLEYCRGSEEETARWAEIVRSYPDIAGEVSLALELHHILSVRVTGAEKEVAASTLKQSIANQPEISGTETAAPIRSIHRMHNRRRFAMLGAAAIAGILVLTAIVYKGMHS